MQQRKKLVHKPKQIQIKDESPVKDTAAAV